ncbi:MAG: hypothetical protein ACYDBQ_02050 [Thermoplasmatota archaeon]
MSGWALALAIAFVLAGCAAPVAPQPSADLPTAMAAAPTTTMQAVLSSAPAASRAPGAPHHNVTFAVALTADTPSGVAPLNVSFQVMAQGTASMAGNLSFGDGGFVTVENFPTNVSHAYLWRGTFNATLVVVAGPQTRGANVTIRVVRDAPLLVAEGLVNESCATECEGCPPPTGCVGSLSSGSSGCLSWQANQRGLDCTWFSVPLLGGHAYEAESTGGTPDLEFMNACPEAAGGGWTQNVYVTGDAWGDGPKEGKLPSDTQCVVAWEFQAGPSRISLQIY